MWRYNVVAACLAAILATAAATGFSGHSTPHSTATGQDLTIHLENQGINTVTLHLKHSAKSNWTTYSGIDNITVPAGDLDVPGTYEYYLSDGSTTTPRQALTATTDTSDYADDLTAETKRYYTNNSFNCKPGTVNDTCYYEHYQAATITSLLRQGHRTGNQTMINDAKAMFTSNWSEGPSKESYGCDPNQNDFDCEQWGNFEAPEYPINGSERQSRIIDYLWDAYRITGNSTIHAYAKNFSDGSAQDCDVWNDDFDCGEQDDQNHMVLAYLKAYATTGNTEYKTIASNLASNVSPTTPKGFHAAIKAHYVLNTSETQTLKQTALQNPPTCTTSCTPSDKRHIVRAWQLLSLIDDDTYAVTHDGSDINITQRYRAQRHQFQPLNADTNHDVYSPISVGNIATTYLRTTEMYPANATPVSGIMPVSQPLPGKDITLQAKLYGNTTNTSITYTDADNPATTNTIKTDQYGFFTIPSTGHSIRSGSMFLNLSVNHDRLSKDRTLSIPAENTNLQGDLSSLLTDPRENCEPFENNDYECLYEYMQGEYAHGIHKAQVQLNNSLGLATTMINADIDPTSGRYSSCEPYSDDYTCQNEPEDDIPTEQDEQGVYRAGLMIQSHVAAYQETKNPELLAEAQQYAYQGHEGCDDYSSTTCNATSLATFLNGVTALHDQQPSNDLADLRDTIASSLASQVSTPSTKETPRAVVALLNHGRLADNTTSINTAQTYLDANTTVCTESGSCPPEQLNLRTQAYWLLFNIARDSTYSQQGNSLINAQPDTDQNACNPNTDDPLATEKYRCEYADEQGTILSAYAEANKHHVLRAPPNITVSISANQTHGFSDQETVTCFAEHVGDNNRSANLTSVELLSDQTINDVDATGTANYSVKPTEVTVSDFTFGEYVNASFNVSYTRGGRDTLRCAVFLAEDEQNITVTDIGEVANTTQIDRQALHTNGYTSKYTLTNNRAFGVANITLNTSHPVKQVTDPWNETNGTITTPLWREGESSNITLDYNASNEGILNASINISGQYGVEQNTSYNVTLINNSLDRQTTLPDFTIFEEETFSSTATNNHPLPINLTVSLSPPSEMNTTLVYNNTTTGTSFTTELVPNQTVTYDTKATVLESTTPSLTTSYTATGIQQSTTKSSTVKTDLASISANDVEVQKNTSYNHTASITNGATDSIDSTTVSFSAGGPVTVINTELEPIEVDKTEERSLKDAVTSTGTVTTNLSAVDNNTVTITDPINLTYESTPNIHNTTVEFTTNESFTATLLNGGASTTCTVSPPNGSCQGFQDEYLQLDPSGEIHLDAATMTASYTEEEKQGQDSPITINTLSPGQTRKFMFTTDGHDTLPQTVNISATSDEGVTASDSIKIEQQPVEEEAGSGSTSETSSGGGSSGGGGGTGSQAGGEIQEQDWVFTYTVSTFDMQNRVSSALRVANISEKYNNPDQRCFNIVKRVKQTAPHAVTIEYNTCLSDKRFQVFDPVPDGLTVEKTIQGYAWQNGSEEGSVTYQAKGSQKERQAFDGVPLIIPGATLEEAEVINGTGDGRDIENRNQTDLQNDNAGNASGRTNTSDPQSDPVVADVSSFPFSLVYVVTGLIVSVFIVYAGLRYARRSGKITAVQLEYLRTKKRFAEDFSSYKEEKQSLTPAQNKLLSMKLRLVRMENLVDEENYDRAKQELDAYKDFVDNHLVSDYVIDLGDVKQELSEDGARQLDQIASRTEAVASVIYDHVEADEPEEDVVQDAAGVATDEEDDDDEEPENPAPDLYMDLKRAELLLKKRRYEEANDTLDHIEDEAEDMKELYPEESAFLRGRVDNIKDDIATKKAEDTWYQVERRIETYWEAIRNLPSKVYSWKS